MKPLEAIPYYIVDVFAESAFCGNQLAVFLDTLGLSPESMQAMAREINFAESTFIRMSEIKGDLFPVRIFTPAMEIPFAGHPTLGTAFVIKEAILKDSIEKVRLALGVGEIPVDMVYVGGELETLWMTQVSPTFGPTFPADEVAALLGLETEDLYDHIPVQQVSTGIPFTIVPIRSLEKVKNIQIQREKFYNFLEKYRAAFVEDNGDVFYAFYCFCPEAEETHNDLHGRMLYHELDITEDSATGSANGCFLSYLLKHQFLGKKPLNLRVEQGYEMQRPSLIKIKGRKLDEDQYLIQVGGSTHMIAKGEWLRTS